MVKNGPGLGRSEDEGAFIARKLIEYINHKKGQFLRGTNDSLHIVIGGKRIPINQDRNNRAMVGLMIDACDVSTIGMAAKIAIQRLEIHADKMAGHLQMRKFSAVSKDGKRLYIPLDDRSLMMVTVGGVRTVINGNNEDGFWIEHPENKPYGLSFEKVAVGLDLFERLLVKTQACEEPSMRWFVSMNEGLFPFVRDLCPARLLVVHTGDSQSGKTTGAQRFTLLHGLGDIKGDFSVATLSNGGDIGLMAIDNKEQGDLTPDFINYLLFLSTGAARGRSYKDGRIRPAETGRPVGVITSIEGIGVKTELRKRCVEVRYAVKGDKLQRGPIEREIAIHRNVINTAIADVLKWFFAFQTEGTPPTPNPIPEFEEHFTVLCNLLRAFGFLSGKPYEWAEGIIQSWNKVLIGREQDEDTLEHQIRRVLDELQESGKGFRVVKTTYDGKTGRLIVTECGALLIKLQELVSWQKSNMLLTPDGLGKRLRSTPFRSFQFLDENRASDLSILKRTTKRRPIAFFMEDDSNDA